MHKVTFFFVMFSEKGMLCFSYYEFILYFLKLLCGRVPVKQKYLLVVQTVNQGWSEQNARFASGRWMRRNLFLLSLRIRLSKSHVGHILCSRVFGRFDARNHCGIGYKC